MGGTLRSARASRADGVGRPFGQVQLRERRRTHAPTGARGDPRPTPSPRAGNWAGSRGGGGGRPAGETLHIRPGPRYLGLGQAAPSLVSAGDPGGDPGREPAGGGGSSAQHPNMAREGERHSCGAARGGAPAGYIKPEREDQRPPQRTAPREASLPSRGDRGPSQRAAGVATRPGRAGVGEGTGTGDQ